MTYDEIQEQLTQAIPPDMLKTRTQGGSNITYVSWYDIANLADERVPGWHGEIGKTQVVGGQLLVTYKIGVPTEDGIVWREDADMAPIEGAGYGNAATNAKAGAFCRAWAQHGLARYLYDKPNTGAAPATQTTGNGSAAPTGGAIPGTNWNGKIWFQYKGDASHKGKDYRDASVPMDMLEWAAQIAKTKEGNPDEPAREAIRAEVARRKGGGGESPPPAAPPAETATEGAAAPTTNGNGSGRITQEDLTKLRDAAVKQGVPIKKVSEVSREVFKKELAELDHNQLSLLYDELDLIPF